MKYFSIAIGLLLTYVSTFAQSCYTLSSIPYSPDSYSGGTSVSMFDDAIFGPVPLGFTFCFYGNLYTNFYIGSNGWVGFSAGQPTTYTTASIPSTSTSVPKNCIMGPWQDWHPGVSGGPYIFYQTTGTAPNRKLVVSWNNCPFYLCTTTLGTFQIIFYESSNIIENHIRNKPNCIFWAFGTAVQGIQNISGTAALTVPGRNSTQWTANNESYRYTPSCGTCMPIPLPVEMLSFSGEHINNRVELSWTTASENDNDHFIVERSADAEFFNDIGKVKGSGSTQQARSYLFYDEQPLEGTFYYRLRQVDFDGAFKYSEIIAVKTDLSVDLILSPVPLNDVMNVLLNMERNAEINLQIINNKGIVVKSQDLQVINGTNYFKIDVAELSAGIYFVRISDDKSDVWSKMVMKW